jgi:hypothetical protein
MLVAKNVANASGKVSIPDPWRYNSDMTTETSSQSLQMPPSATRVLGIFERDARLSYGDDLLMIVLFKSRARGDAGHESDVDMSLGLSATAAPTVIAWLISPTKRSWKPASIYTSYRSRKRNGRIPIFTANPALIWAIKRDGMPIVERAARDLA